MKFNTVTFQTLGCRLNQSETSMIEHTFKQNGYTIVPFNKPADVVVINTCTVTENGDADTRRLINKACRINPSTRIALIGCQAQIQKEKLTNLPNVQWVVGNAQKMNLQSIIDSLPEEENNPIVITPTIEKETFTMPASGIDHHHTRANIKIQDGCDFFCSFCEIPYARGRARSREFEDIMIEANMLVKSGHQELVITGINVGTYEHHGRNLMDVINSLEQIDGLVRIRLSSIEPTTVPENLIRKMASTSKLCRYLHLPLQSANNAVLNSMNRKYTYEEYLNFIEQALSQVDQLCIGTDVIVGYPTETNEYFQDTYNKLLESPIHYFHVFSYSKRQLAKSRQSIDEIPTSTIKERSRLLRELSQRKRHLYYQSLCGTNQNVLFEQNKSGLWQGVTDHYVRVGINSERNLTNQIQPVYLEHAEPSIVLASLV